MSRVDENGEAARVAAAVAVSRGGGWRYIHAPQTDASRHVFVHALRPRLVRLGFLVIPGTVAPTAAVLARITHRHVALVVCSAGARARSRAWMRALSRRSVRAHVVIDLMEAGMSGDRGMQTRRQLLRARHFLERRRGAAAERWLRAAMAAAARRGADLGQAEAAAILIEQLVASDRPHEALSVARSALAGLDRDDAIELVRLAEARALVAVGDLRSSDAALTAVSSAHRARGESGADPTASTRAEVAFWRGEAVAGDGGAASPAVSGLIAWARADGRALAGVIDRCGSSPWRAALAGLAAVVSGRETEIVAAVRRLNHAAWRKTPAADARLLRAVAAELWLSLGRRADALAALGPVVARAEGATMVDRLHAWLRCRARGGVADESLTRWMAQSGARGICRWGGGNAHMHTLHALPPLLRIIEGAEDEAATLRGAADWLCAEAGSRATAFHSTDGHLLAASEEWHERAPPDIEVRAAIAECHRAGVVSIAGPCVVAPIRYGGTGCGTLTAVAGPGEPAALSAALAVVATLCAPAVRTRLDAMRLRRSGASLAPDILGASPAVSSLRETIARVAGTPFPVLIEGDSGTGKELVARALHRLSPRRDRRFCSVNCAAISDDLLEAELFGHSRGAFTGAAAPRVGLFEDAHGGTIFLDEVAELSARAQAKLLRVLQEREVRRVGENAARTIDVRVIAATNCSLAEMARRHAFRQDLLFRLSVVRIRVPPLSARLEDVPLLAQAFWRETMKGSGTQAVLGPDALAELCRHAWPGNVRELQNAVSALAVVAPLRGRVTARHVRHVLAEAAGGEPTAGLHPLAETRQVFERDHIAAALARNGGRRAGAARELGMSRQGLVKAIKRLGLRDPPDEAGVA